jgi:hypothetical protein
MGIEEKDKEKNNTDDGSHAVDSASNEQSPEMRPLKGLCINCENRHTCVLPRPVEGVWHCEEYL